MITATLTIILKPQMDFYEQDILSVYGEDALNDLLHAEEIFAVIT